MANKEYEPGNSVKFAPKADKPDFTGYLRAVNVDRLNPANNQANAAPLLLGQPKSGHRDHVNNVRLLQATGVLVSVIWLIGASLYIQRMIGWENVSNLKPHEMGGFMAGILTPVALFWMVAAFIMRSNDVKIYAEALREEIQNMIFPSEEANRRVNNDIERLMRQTSEMSKATHIALSAIETAREGLRNQVNMMNTGSAETVDRLTTLGLSLNARMRDVAMVGAQLEQSLSNIEQSTIVAEEKLGATNKQLLQSADLIGTSTQSTEEAVGRISQMLRQRLEDLGSLHQQTEEALKTAATEIASQRENLQIDANDLESKALTIGDALRKGTNTLYEFSDDALDKAKLIETKLQSQSASLQNVLRQANDNAAAIETATTEAVIKLQNTATDATNETYKIEDILEQAISRLKEATKASVANAGQILDQGTERLDKTVEQNMTRLVQAIAQNSTGLEKTINDAGTHLENALQSVQQNLNKAANDLTSDIDRSAEKARVELEMAIAFISGSTQSALENMTAKIDDAGDKAETTFGTLRQELDKTTEHLTTKIDHAGNRVKNNLQGVQETLDQAIDNLNKRSEASVQQVQHAILENTNVLMNNVETIGNRATLQIKQTQGEMETATNRLVEGIDGVSIRAKNITNTMLSEVNRKVTDTTAAFAYIQNQIQSLVGLFDQRKLHLDEAGNSARQTAEAMQHTLQAALDKVQKTAQVLQSGIGAIGASVQEPITLLENAATMAHQRAGDIAQLLSRKTEDVTQHIRKMGDDAQHAQQHLQSKSQDVALLAGKIASQLKLIGQEMDEQGGKLDTRIEHSVQSLTALSTAQKTITQDVGKLRDETAQVTEQTAASTEAIQQRIDLLQQLHKTLAGDAVTSKGELDRVSDRIVAISGTTMDSVKNTLENMTLLEADYHRLSEAGVDSIQRLETGYRDTLGVIQIETENTAQKIVTLQSELQNSSAKTTDAMQAHLHTLQTTFENLDQTVHKVADFGDTIALHTDRIGELGSQFLQGNEQISIQARSVQEILGQMKDHTIEAVDSFMQHGIEVENNLQSQLVRLNNVNQNLVVNMGEVNDALSQNINETENLSNKITIQIGKIKTEGEGAYAELGIVLERITSVNSQLADQRSEMNATGDDLLDRLQQATQQIGSKAAALEQAALEASNQAEALREQQTKFNQEAFFNSTKFIVESLHSLALDFTRMLDGELNEKTWLSYKKGDTGAFTKRLLSTRDEDTQNKVRNKFKEDVEFRTYVQRYLRQFEEIYDSAERNDHAHLLTSIFMTSDVGKLYQFICTILERAARGTAK